MKITTKWEVEREGKEYKGRVFEGNKRVLRGLDWVSIGSPLKGFAQNIYQWFSNLILLLLVWLFCFFKRFNDNVGEGYLELWGIRCVSSNWVGCNHIIVT